MILKAQLTSQMSERPELSLQKNIKKTKQIKVVLSIVFVVVFLHDEAYFIA